MVAKVDLRTNDTRKRILQEAQSLFEAGGYNELSMEKIAEILGLKRPTLYYHFPGGKEQLVVETIRVMTAEQMAAWQRAIEAGHDTRSRLRNILDAAIDYPVFGNVRPLLVELWQVGEDVRTTLTQSSAQIFKLLSEVFEEGFKKGELRPVELSLATMGFFALCDQIKNLILVRQNYPVVIPFKIDFDQEELADKLFEMWLSGLEVRCNSTS